MTTGIRFAFAAAAIVCALASVTHARATPTGSAFTYQGMLKSGGAPASGTFHLRFQLWDALSGGVQVGADVDQTSLVVTDGLFTTELNFGTLAFNGSARWLQVQIITNGGTTVTTLVPRQAVAATPYALFALGVDGPSLVNLNASNLASGTVPSAQLGGNYSNALALSNINNTFTGSFTGTGVALTNLNATSISIGTLSASRLPSGGNWPLSSALNIDSTTLVIDAPNNRVGVGTTTPTHTVHIASTGPTLALQDTDSTTDQVGYVSYRDSGNVERAWVGYGTAGSQVFSIVNARTTGHIALLPFAGGNVGIGTTTPTHTVHIASTAPTLAIQDTNSTTDQVGYVSYRDSGNVERAWVGYGTPGSQVFSIVNARPTGHIALLPFAGGNVGIGTTAPAAKLHVIGTTRTTVLEITGADLAEKFPVSEPIEPGMVVCIDLDRAGLLCLSRSAYDRAVAGIVSGANGFAAGAILGNLPGHDASPPVALSGRVYVWCDAAELSIEPGDFLTTSDTPGHAMKAADLDRSRGAVIGKAMTPLASGRGLVLVLVNLQ